MKQFEAESSGFWVIQDRQMRSFRFITGAQVWLALDDAHEDSRVGDVPLTVTEWATVDASELARFYQQLFYWRLIKKGPPLLSDVMFREDVRLSAWGILN